MAKYAILIYDDPSGYQDMSPEAWQATIDAHSKFVEQVAVVHAAVGTHGGACAGRI